MSTLFWPLEKGHFQDGVQDDCWRLKLLISKALFNLERCSWCQIVGFNSIFNILKASFSLVTIKESFSRWRPRWLPKAKIVDIQGTALFNLERCSWRQIVGFNSCFNIIKVSFILTTRKGSFSRWRPRWLPRAEIVVIQHTIQPRKVFLV